MCAPTAAASRFRSSCCKDWNVERVFREISRLTNGAYLHFNAGAARQLAELLRAIATFAIGGVTALEATDNPSATKLSDSPRDRQGRGRAPSHRLFQAGWGEVGKIGSPSTSTVVRSHEHT
jgi:hypothetical protein